MTTTRRGVEQINLETDESGCPSVETAILALASLIDSGRLKTSSEADAATITGGKTIADVETALASVKTDLNAITGAGYTVKTVKLDGVTGTAQQIIAAVTGKALYIVGGHITCTGAAGKVTVLDNATAVDYLMMAIDSGLSIIPRPMTRPLWKTAAGAALKMTTQTSQALTGMLEYIEV